MTYEVALAGKTYKVQFEFPNESSAPQQSLPTNAAIDWNLQIDGRAALVNCLRANDSLSLIIGGESYAVRVERADDKLRVHLCGQSYECTVRDPRSLRSRKRAGQAEGGPQKLTASMPGKVVRVLVRAGETVAVGQGILVIEAMKMQNEVRSLSAGILKSVSVKEGANVNAGQVLAVIE